MFENACGNKSSTALELLNSKKVLSKFYLAGGSALALQIGERISYDLDFFSQYEFEPQKLLDSIKDIFKTQRVEMTDGSLKLFTKEIEVSFFFYEYPLIFKKIEYKNMYLAGIGDIALMKIIAIGNRGVRKDFYDLYFILKKYYSIKDLFNIFDKKFGVNTFNQFHYLKSLIYFDNADNDKGVINLVSSKVSWDEVKNFFMKEVKNII